MRQQIPACLLAVLLVVLDASPAEAARRSLRIDFGSDWGDAKECDPGQLGGNQLRWRGYTFAGWTPLPVGNTFCQFAAGLGEANMYSAEDAPVKNLLRTGETISAARYWFLSGSSDFPGEGDQGFQWVLYYFDDVTIVGLNGPAVLDDSFAWQPLAVDATTTWLKDAGGTTLWAGAGFDGQYLCFRTDGSFIGAVSAASLGTCRGGPDTDPALPALLSPGDAGGDATPDRVLVRGAGPFTAEVRNGPNNALLREVPFFNTGYRAIDAVALPDTNGDGRREAALVVRRDSDDRYMLQVRNLEGLPETRSWMVPAGFRPLRLASAGDGDGNGAADIGMLALRESDERAWVITMNLFGPVDTTYQRLANGAEPLGLAVVDDADADGTPEYAALLRRRSDGRAMVQVTDATSTTGAAPLFYAGGRRPVDIAIVDDANADGVPEVAVLLVNNSVTRTVVHLRNADGVGGDARLVFSRGYTPLALGQGPMPTAMASPNSRCSRSATATAWA